MSHSGTTLLSLTSKLLMEGFDSNHSEWRLTIQCNNLKSSHAHGPIDLLQTFPHPGLADDNRSDVPIVWVNTFPTTVLITAESTMGAPHRQTQSVLDFT